ncbi:MAG: HEAT repeat domain-containing protein [Deltaproteobacteria bacterium]|nr:HEAT repeat domain-containing protein [Deltaproteobacteria bacterium]
MDKRKEILLKALQDPDVELRKIAADSLEKLQVRDRLDAIINKIGSGEMLEKIRAVYALADIKGEKVIAAGAKALKDPSEDVRAAAARVMGSFGDIRVLPHLVEAFKDASSMVVRSALDAFVKYNDSRYIEHLMPLLKNPDAGVVEKALEAVASTGDKRAEEAMIYFTVKGNPKMKAIALRALGEMDR